MASTTNYEPAAVSPAQIAALCVSIFAIVVFTSISIYLCGRHEGCKDATQRAIHSMSHLHHHHHRRIPEETQRDSVSRGHGTNGGRFSKLKEAFGIKGVQETSASSSSSAARNRDVVDGNAPRMRATSPLQIHTHPGSHNSNPYSGTDEFQAAVHNLLGYRPGELAEWYPESDDDAHEEPKPQHEEERENPFSGNDECGSPLPAYEEVVPEEPRRFSWQGQESDYRPEKH